MIGIALSVIFPGLGQFYYGKWVRGTMMVLGGVTPVYPLAVEEAKGSGRKRRDKPA
jgi:TM2 domain-containing membrane protein YozV